jgi:hypothetical protein
MTNDADLKAAVAAEFRALAELLCTARWITSLVTKSSTARPLCGASRPTRLRIIAMVRRRRGTRGPKRLGTAGLVQHLPVDAQHGEYSNF